MDTDIARIASLLADCRAKARAGGTTDTTDEDWEYSADDLDWVCAELGRHPTREEWRAAGLAYVGGDHVGWPVPEGLTWHVPPRCQGQIVEVAFAAGEGYYYRRRFDRADRAATFSRVDMALVDDGEWQPWNEVPGVRDDAWEDQ